MSTGRSAAKEVSVRSRVSEILQSQLLVRPISMLELFSLNILSSEDGMLPATENSFIDSHVPAKTVTSPIQKCEDTTLTLELRDTPKHTLVGRWSWFRELMRTHVLLTLHTGHYIAGSELDIRIIRFQQRLLHPLPSSRPRLVT